MCQPSFNNPCGRMIDINDAVGTVLAHDLTEIRPGEFKGPAFKKGHVVTPDDLGRLARLGKRRLYVLDIPPGMMHEDEAALVLAGALAGPGVTYTPSPSEGKINLKADCDGLLKVNAQALTDFNLREGVMCASRHTDSLVRRDEIVAGTRAIPLIIAQTVVEEAAEVARRAGGVIEVKPLARPLTGLVITGHEVYSGLIQDRFAPKIKPKLEAFGCTILPEVFAPDDPDFIARAIGDLLGQGARLLVLTGGMSVDPDDVTRHAVAKAGAGDILYGSAVLPGAMLMLAGIDGVPIIGVPACALFHERTIFDFVLPRVLAGEKLTRRDLAALGHGGLCLNCQVCRFPVCPFGKHV
ncbi:MAG: molybdopterin-binding protein [Thermodesulfobacteriota bacterium]